MNNSRKIEVIRESAAIGDIEYLKLFELLEQYCCGILNNPEQASSMDINSYNRLVRSSGLKLPEKRELYI